MACSFGVYVLVIFALSLGSPRHGELRSQARWQVFNITCDPQDTILQKERCESESLETIADIVRKQKLFNVQINIQTARLKLTTNITFFALESLNISGENDYGMTGVICTAGRNDSAGIILRDISGMITLNRLNLTFCGSYVQTDYYNGDRIYWSALAMLYCMNVQLNSVIIAESRGLGLIILNHQGGRVNINSTIFKDNILPQEYFQDPVFGGGGVYIHLDQEQCRHHLNYSFQFSNCTLYNNIAHTFKYNFGSTNYLGNVDVEYGRGGGVYLSILSGIKNIYASFTDCVFIYNHAFVGGGLYAKIYGPKSDKETNNVTIEIKNSLFKHNGCGNTSTSNTNTTYGGAIYLAFSAYIDRQGLVLINNSHYLVRNVSFIENCAEIGGGVMYYSEHGKRGISNNINNSMLFDNCTFIGNRAHIGSAVDLIPSVFKKTSTW